MDLLFRETVVLILLYVKTMVFKKAAISENKSPHLAAGALGNSSGYFCISDKAHQHTVSMSTIKIKGSSDQSADLLFLVHM